MQPQIPATRTERAPVAILGVPFDSVTTPETLGLVGDMVASGRPHYAATANVDFIMQAVEDAELRRILCDAHLVLADGRPVFRAAKFLGNPLPECVAGPRLISQLLALAEQKGWKVFLLGGTEPGVAAAAEKIRAQHPKLQIVGAYAPPEKPLLEMDHQDILRRIREAKPDILLAAFGCPKQEKWISMNYREAGVPFVLGAGATFDFAAGAGRPEKTGGKKFWQFTLAVLRQWRLLRSQKFAPPTGAEATVEPDPFGNLVIHAPKRLGMVEVNAFAAEWLRAVESGHVMFDLGGTEFADSTGIGQLIRLRKRARELDHHFFLVAPRPAVEAALRQMRLEEFFTIQPSFAATRILMENLAHAPVVTSGAKESELQIRWTGEVTALNAVELGAHTDSELYQASPGMTVVIDLSRVTFVDSTGIGLMLRFKKNLKRRDIHLKFANPVASVRNVLRHTQLEEYLLGGK
jgi:N-acetylglucosaminyldiphosphoundecaprenol N-acetyl-beta-D-mannosaminyltransferase